MDQKQVVDAAHLDFARGMVGLQTKLGTPEARYAFAHQLALHTRPLTKVNTADCGDERKTLRFANGNSDLIAIAERVVPQLFGGLALAATKASISANAVIIRDAKNVTEAYHIVSDFLANANEEDGGHPACGASGSVESSVASSLSYEEMRAPVGLFVPMNERVSSLLQKNMQHQQSALQAGFYGDWNPGNHEDYLSNRFPENFSLLADDPNDHVTHGHHGSGIYVVTSEGYGFAKNDFIDDTNGAESFAVTLRKMTQVASIIGGSEEEKQRIILGFYTDTLQVGSGIVMPGMPVFTEAA